MPRLPRLLLPGVPLHIVQRGIDRQPCFFSDGDYLRYLDMLAAHTAGCQVHAYVLMSNHVHLLLSFDDMNGPSTLMKALDQIYCQHINWRLGRSGSLWEGRYKSCLVQDEHYFLTCQRYIELNPVRAGLADYPGQYRWSSYRANAEGKASAVVRPHPTYQRLGIDGESRRRAYRGLFEESLRAKDIDDIRRATVAGFGVGDQAFLARLARTRNRAAC